MRRSITRALTFGVLVLAGLASAAGPAGAEPSPSAAATSWPMALHDARHGGVAQVVGPQAGHVAWTRHLGASITPGPVIGTGGTIYVATNAGVLHAIDPASGEDRWTLDESPAPHAASTSTDLSVSPLALSSGSIIWPTLNGTLEEVSAAGIVEWSHSFSGRLTSPVITPRGLYIGTTRGTVAKVSLNGPTPSIEWTKSIGHVSYGSPVVAPDGQIITTVDNCVVDLIDNGASASIRWFHAFRSSVEVSAAVSTSGTIVVGANTGAEYGFSPSGHQRWMVSLHGALSYSSPTVSGKGIAYFGDNNGVLRAVQVASGRPVSTYHGNRGLWAAQAIDRTGDVYFGTQGHSILGYSARGRRLLDLAASGPIDGYPALGENGHLIIGDEAGTLYSIG